MSLFSNIRAFIRRQEAKKSHDVQTENHENDRELASEDNRTCPFCGGHKDKLELLCYYSNEGIMWSDYRHVLPQMATPSLVQKCQRCGKYYISKASHVLIKDTADFEFIDPVSWDYFRQSYEEYTQQEKDNRVDFNHRLRMLGAFNDEFRRAQNPPVPTEQDIKMFQDNVLHLIEYIPDPLGKAEMYREVGMFEECFKQLDMVEDGGDESIKSYKETIFNLAKQKSINPFGWKAE